MINGSDFGLLVGLTSQNRDTSLSYGSTTDSIPEGSNNLYFTSLRARSVYTVQLPLLYNQSSGELALQAGSSSLNGYISSSDWTTFNNKSDFSGSYNDLTDIPSGYTGSVTVVTGVDFAFMTTTTKTITINNGIVVGVE